MSAMDKLRAGVAFGSLVAVGALAEAGHWLLACSVAALGVAWFAVLGSGDHG